MLTATILKPIMNNTAPILYASFIPVIPVPINAIVLGMVKLIGSYNTAHKKITMNQQIKTNTFAFKA